MLSKEAKKILVKDAVIKLMKEDSDWNKIISELPKEDILEIVDYVTDIYADCRVLAISFAKVYNKNDDETIERIVNSVINLNVKLLNL